MCWEANLLNDVINVQGVHWESQTRHQSKNNGFQKVLLLCFILELRQESFFSNSTSTDEQNTDNYEKASNHIRIKKFLPIFEIEYDRCYNHATAEYRCYDAAIDSTFARVLKAWDDHNLHPALKEAPHDGHTEANPVKFILNGGVIRGSNRADIHLFHCPSLKVGRIAPTQIAYLVSSILLYLLWCVSTSLYSSEWLFFLNLEPDIAISVVQNPQRNAHDALWIYCFYAIFGTDVS